MLRVGCMLRLPTSRTTRSARGFAVLAHNWAGGEAQSASSTKTVVLMHGILGSKSNWNTPARRLLDRAAPFGWRVLQVDHRSHGQSPIGDGPHSLQACAADLAETLEAVGVDADSDDLIVCGHSFGGKVALTYLQERLVNDRLPPRMTWLFDSVPGCPSKAAEPEELRKDSVPYVFGAVEDISRQGPFADRAAVVNTLTDQYEVPKPVAQWIAQSTKSTDCGGVQLLYDMEVVRAMYDDYQRTDLWPLVEKGEADVGVLVAGRNLGAWGSDNLARLSNCGDHVTHVTLHNAGHNVHVDDLPGVLDAIDSSLQ
eukprot:TRINITY_DN33111_c0_g1_i2.p1 TRINITY_DN33111_c0_g1~~TRINITY_DN33111_c0_g1_i2.p1  ORF type:complete len:338 (-),score=23.17 TRINITY_DN33111_c0_g1_i2:12-947(-)